MFACMLAYAFMLTYAYVYVWCEYTVELLDVYSTAKKACMGAWVGVGVGVGGQWLNPVRPCLEFADLTWTLLVVNILHGGAV